MRIGRANRPPNQIICALVLHVMTYIAFARSTIVVFCHLCQLGPLTDKTNTKNKTLRAGTHRSLLTTHYSLLTTHYSLLTTHYSLLATHYSLLTTHYSLLTTHYSLLTTHYSLLTTHYSLLTTHYSLLTTHYSLLTTHAIASVATVPRPGQFAAHPPRPPGGACDNQPPEDTDPQKTSNNAVGVYQTTGLHCF